MRPIESELAQIEKMLSVTEPTLGELVTMATPPKSDPTAHVRSQALFWLSQKAGKKAAGALRDAVDDDPEEGVREKAVFAVSQLPDDQSVPMLIDLMKAA